MMSAFGGLASPHGSCLLDPVQPWGLSLPRWPCTCSLPPGEVGDVTVLGTWGAGHRHCRGGGRGGAGSHGTPGFPIFPSLPPSLRSCPFIRSFIQCWAPVVARRGAGLWGGGGEAWGEGNQSSCKSCPQGATAGNGGQTAIGCFLSYFGALGSEGGKAAL